MTQEDLVAHPSVQTFFKGVFVKKDLVQAPFEGFLLNVRASEQGHL